VAVLAEHPDEAKIIAGGQSLVPLMALRLSTPKILVDLNRVPGLDYLRDTEEGLEIGALARQAWLERRPGLAGRCPMITEALSLIGHVAIRNRGTVAGSLAHADPAAEWPAVLLALDGDVEATGPLGVRTISSPELFVTHFTTALAPDEVLTKIRLPIPSEGRVGSAFLELARRHGDFAMAGAAAVLKLADDGTVAEARVALFGVKDTAVRARLAEEALKGQRPTDDRLREAAEAIDADIAPTSDLHASSEDRRAMAKVLTRRTLARARERAEAGGA
jgi:aerobic carbon-monoxide dehydrogenase medium subunit